MQSMLRAKASPVKLQHRSTLLPTDVVLLRGDWPQPMHGRRSAIVGRMHADAFSQGIAERDRAPMLLEHVAEGFLGEVLQPLAGLKAELIERVPGLGVEFEAASDCLLLHGAAISSGIAAKT
jgi:hypothetical protein